MKLDSYLSQSRHGIFYFRWPLPRIDDQQRSTVRISLGTRCPHAAGDLARYLASHGRLIRGDERLAKLRHDEMRRMVRDYFRSVQAKFEERLNSQGLHPRMIPSLTEDLEFIEDAIAHQDGESMGANVNFDAWITDGFREHAGLDEAQWQD
ncbi:hypothetical protein [Mangrovicoccus sp. HB161399]|uniref:hypothetical protein n=1 Tax=Mangrovicoccus sp. HB161399 TaxID=2720392 RepID=UPI0015569E15|nr:hypothetical protein [Mangrovicoccus sp. HB161399]